MFIDTTVLFCLGISIANWVEIKINLPASGVLHKYPNAEGKLMLDLMRTFKLTAVSTFFSQNAENPT